MWDRWWPEEARSQDLTLKAFVPSSLHIVSHRSTASPWIQKINDRLKPTTFLGKNSQTHSPPLTGSPKGNWKKPNLPLWHQPIGMRTSPKSPTFLKDLFEVCYAGLLFILFISLWICARTAPLGRESVLSIPALWRRWNTIFFKSTSQAVKDAWWPRRGKFILSRHPINPFGILF